MEGYRLRTGKGEAATGAPPLREGALPAILARAQRLANDAAERPYRSTAILLALNMALAGLFFLTGLVAFSDQAEMFRELMPGTWLSFAELLFLAAVAWAIQQRVTGSRRLRYDNFWGLSAVVFLVFAFDEITQLTIYLSQLLTSLGALAPAGFRDLDAFLLTVLFVAAGAVLLRHAPVLLLYPAAVALLAVGVALGVASQGLDAVLASSSGEFALEETLKLAAEPFLIGGYLVILHRVSAKKPGA